MPRRGKRRRLAENILSDASGISGFLRVRGVREEIRFPSHMSVSEIRRALDARRRQLEAILPESPLRGSLRAVVEQFTKTLGTTRPERELKSRLQPWVTACGDRPFALLTRAELDTIVAGWRQGGTSPNTCAKRISSLRAVWRRSAPDDAPLHAIERLARPRTPKAIQIRARPMDLVAIVLTHVATDNPANGEASKAYARLQLLAWTGQPPALLQQVLPEHVRWHATPPELYVQPRRKGAGTDAAWIPLLPQAVAALKLFFKVQAQGAWNRGVIRHAWNRAIVRAQAELREQQRGADADRLTGMRPYDLRHSMLSALGTATGDLHAVSEYARHSDVRTTLVYLRGASSLRVQQGIAALTAQLPSSPPDVSATPRPKPQRKPSASRRVKKSPRAGRSTKQTS